MHRNKNVHFTSIAWAQLIWGKLAALLLCCQLYSLKIKVWRSPTSWRLRVVIIFYDYNMFYRSKQSSVGNPTLKTRWKVTQKCECPYRCSFGISHVKKQAFPNPYSKTVVKWQSPAFDRHKSTTCVCLIYRKKCGVAMHGMITHCKKYSMRIRASKPWCLLASTRPPTNYAVDPISKTLGKLIFCVLVTHRAQANVDFDR